MSLLDVIGPVMVGPSSSHTAGACRLALLARYTLKGPPQKAKLELHGSFAKTGKGHGTHHALVAGLIGCFPDDERIPRAFELAKEKGLEVDLGEKDLGDVHPNTVRINLENSQEKVSVTGSSLGGGLVKIFKIGDFEVNFSGSFFTLLVEHSDRPGMIASVARVLADDGINIATIHSSRRKRGGDALMSVETDRPPPAYALEYLRNLPHISWTRSLPEVMSGEKEESRDAE